MSNFTPPCSGIRSVFISPGDAADVIAAVFGHFEWLVADRSYDADAHKRDFEAGRTTPANPGERSPK